MYIAQGDTEDQAMEHALILVENSVKIFNKHVLVISNYKSIEEMCILSENTKLLNLENLRGRSVDEKDIVKVLEEYWNTGFHFDVVLFDLKELLGYDTDYDYGSLELLIKEVSKNFNSEGFLSIIPKKLSNEKVERLNSSDNLYPDLEGESLGSLMFLADNVNTIYTNKYTKEVMFLTERIRNAKKCNTPESVHARISIGF